MTYGTGYVKDESDPRDYSWRAAVQRSRIKLPAEYIVPDLGPVLDQGDEPKCVAFSSASLKFHQEYKEHQNYFDFDPHWLYALCKQRDGIPNQGGTFIRVALQIIQTMGYLAKASPGVLEKDTNFKVKNYVRLNSVRQIKEALYKVGPVLFGIMIDDGYYAPNTDGVIPEPTNRTEGGHAMIAVGYNDNIRCQGSQGAVRVKNSWGSDYGDGGYIWVPYTHFTRYSDWDAWRVVDSADILEDYDPKKGLE